MFQVNLGIYDILVQYNLFSDNDNMNWIIFMIMVLDSNKNLCGLF